MEHANERLAPSCTNTASTNNISDNNKMSARSRMTQHMPRINFKNLLLGAACLALVVALLLPNQADVGAHAKKLKFKEKKLLKSLFKGLIVKNLSTKKNFLPLPVPIPVPIELSDPPVYLKGKPKYVTVYKPTQKPKPSPAPVIKPTTVYHMPVYSPRTYEYMMDPYSIYGSMLMGGSHSQANPSAQQAYIEHQPIYGDTSMHKYAADSHSAYGSGGGGDSSASGSSSSTHAAANYPSQINFTDYDDEFGSYYVGKRRAEGGPLDRSASVTMQRADIDNRVRDNQAAAKAWIMSTDEQESLDPASDVQGSRSAHPQAIHTRNKRQVYYKSGYDGNKPCHGFPLEINVRSRIKLDQVFPIYGNSQMKKCVKLQLPQLPLPEAHDGY